MIGWKVTVNWGRSSRKSYFRNQGIEPDEPGVDLDGLALGWIENSLHKTLRELERWQMVRQYRRQEAEQEQSASLRNKAAAGQDERQGDLKNKANLYRV